MLSLKSTVSRYYPFYCAQVNQLLEVQKQLHAVLLGSPKGGSEATVATPGSPGGGAGIVVSGDTIFPGSCGRLDLPDADKERMFHSLAKCASALRDEMTVYPGHNYNGTSSTIAKEKRDGLLRPFTKTQWEAMMGGK